MIIDVHAHTSNHKMVGLHTEDASLPALKKMAQEQGVERVCLMATYFPYKKSGVPNRVLLDRIAGDPFFRVFGSLDMTTDFLKGATELDVLLQEKRIHGIKLYPGYQLFSLYSERALLVYFMAGKFQVPVMVHGGTLHHCCRRDEKNPYRCGRLTCPLDGNKALSLPNQLTGGLRTFPHVNFIMSHLGYPHMDELIYVMQTYPNLLTDIGGIIRTGYVDDDNETEKQRMADEVKRIIKEVPNGIDRVLFATDFPIQGFATSVELVKRMNLSQEDENKITHGNALRLGL